MDNLGSFTGLVEHVHKMRVHIGSEQRQQPLKTPVGEVVSTSHGRTFGATVGLVRSHGCEVVVALQAGESERVQSLLREFLSGFLSGRLDIGDHFTHSDRRYTSEVLDILGLGPGHSPLDAFLVAMEPLKRVIELIPVADVLDQDGIERSFVLKTVQAEWRQGLHQARLVDEAEPWRQSGGYEGEERRFDDAASAWYSTLPGYRRLEPDATWDRGGGVVVHLFARDLMAADSPYSAGTGQLASYRELVLMGTQPTGERAFIVRAIHLSCDVTEELLEDLDAHDHLWLSTFLDRQGGALVPRPSGRGDAVWGHANRPGVEMLRITAIEAHEEYRSLHTLQEVLVCLQGKVLEDTGSPPVVTTFEAREVAGTQLLGAQLAASDRQWIEKVLHELGAVAGAKADLNFSEDGATPSPCRRHPVVFMLPLHPEAAG